MKNSFEANINIVLEAHFGSASQTEEYQLNIIFILEAFSSEPYLKKQKTNYSTINRNNYNYKSLDSCAGM